MVAGAHHRGNQGHELGDTGPGGHWLLGFSVFLPWCLGLQQLPGKEDPTFATFTHSTHCEWNLSMSVFFLCFSTASG